MVAWLSFFLFAGNPELVFSTRGVLSWRHDVLGLVSCSAGVWAFLKYLDMHALMFGSTGDRGEMAMAVASPARLALFLRSTPDTFLLLPVQRQSIELPATTEGE